MNNSLSLKSRIQGISLIETLLAQTILYIVLGLFFRNLAITEKRLTQLQHTNHLQWLVFNVEQQLRAYSTMLSLDTMAQLLQESPDVECSVHCLEHISFQKSVQQWNKLAGYYSDHFSWTILKDAFDTYHIALNYTDSYDTVHALSFMMVRL